MQFHEGKLRRMRLLANEHGDIAAVAMDHEGLKKALAVARGVDMREITPEMMSEFKEAVSRVLTPHASAILLDPVFGMEAARARATRAGLLLAYELSGYDNSRSAGCPICFRTCPSSAAWIGRRRRQRKSLLRPSRRRFDKRHQARVCGASGPECEAHHLPFFPGVGGIRPIGRRRTRAGIRQDEARDREAGHGGVFQTAVSSRCSESGSAGECRIRPRLRPCSKDRELIRERMPCVTSGRPRAWRPSRSSS